MIDKNDILYRFKRSYHISYNQDYFCCVGAGVNLYHYKNGEFVANFKGLQHPDCSGFTSDQNLIVRTTVGKYHVYNLASMEYIKKILPPKKDTHVSEDFQITSDDKYIIDFFYVYPTAKLVVVEIETGTHTFFDLGYARHGLVLQTETESKYYVVTICAEELHAPDVSILEFYEFTYTSGKFNLKKLFSQSQGSRVMVSEIDYRANKFAFADYRNKIRLFDVQTGSQDEFEYEEYDFLNGILYDMKLSKNGRYIALATSDNIYVFDLETKECIKNYEVDYGCFVDFIDDDTKLLIGTWEKGYCVAL